MKQVLVMEMPSYYGTCMDENTQSMLEHEAQEETLINITDEWSEHSTLQKKYRTYGIFNNTHYTQHIHKIPDIRYFS